MLLILLPQCSLLDIDDLGSGTAGGGGGPPTSVGSATTAAGAQASSTTKTTSTTALAVTSGQAQTGSGLNCGEAIECGGECIDAQSNALHCGYCDHDCEGGECTLGECQPVLMWDALSGSATGVDVNDTEVFWSTTGGVLAMSKSAAPGTSPRTVTSLYGARVAATSMSVYISGTAVKKVHAGTGALQTTFTSPLSCRYDLQVDASHLHCTGAGVYRFNLDGTGMVELQTGLTGWHSVAADASHIYWTDANNRLKRRPVDLSQPAQDYVLTNVGGAVRIYESTLFALAEGLWAVDLNSGTPTMLDPTLSANGMLVVDDRDVVVTQWGGSGIVARISWADGKRTDYNTPAPDVVTMDDKYVFFTGDTRLFRVVR